MQPSVEALKFTVAEDSAPPTLIQAGVQSPAPSARAMPSSASRRQSAQRPGEEWSALRRSAQSREGPIVRPAALVGLRGRVHQGLAWPGQVLTRLGQVATPQGTATGPGELNLAVLEADGT